MRRVLSVTAALLTLAWTAWCLAALGTGGALADTPAAAPPGCTACQGGIRYGSSGFAGAFTVATPAGPVGDTFCVESHKWYPDSAHAAGVTLDVPDVAVWAAFLTPAGRDDADQAAVSERVGRDLEGVDEKWRAVDQHARSDQLWAQAAASAGPYTLRIDVVTAPAGTQPGTVHVAVTSAAGQPVPAAVTLQGTGADVVAQVATPADVALAVPGSGAWSLQADAHDLPPTTVLRYAALDPREQSVVGAGPPSAATATVGGTAERPTKVSVQKLDATTGAPLAGAVVEIRDHAGDIAARVTTTEVPVAVPLPLGTYVAREVRAPVGHVLDDPAPQPFTVSGRGDAVALRWSDHRARPQLTTSASAARTSPGGSVTDTVTVTGLPDHQPAIDLTVRLLGPVPPATCADPGARAFADAPTAATTTVTVRGNGEVVSPPVTVPRASGCYTFTETSTRPLWPGGPTLVSAPGAPGESVEVVAPTLHTVVTATTSVPAGTVADVVTVEGLPAWAGARTLTVGLAGPVPPAADGSCESLPGTAWAGVTVAVSTSVVVTGDGPVTTPAVTVPGAVGCWSFTETDTAPLWPGGPTLTSPAGRPGESVLVQAPAPTTGPTTGPPTTGPPTLAATGPDLPLGRLTTGGVALVADGLWLASWGRRRRPTRALSR